MLPTAQRYGMGVLTWGPLSAGWLSGRDLSASSRAGLESQKFDLSIPGNARKAEAVHALSEVAEEAGLPLPHLATAFVRSHPAVTSVIIGPRTLDQLDSMLEGSEVTLGADVLDRIDAIVPRAPTSTGPTPTTCRRRSRMPRCGGGDRDGAPRSAAAVSATPLTKRPPRRRGAVTPAAQQTQVLGTGGRRCRHLAVRCTAWLVGRPDGPSTGAVCGAVTLGCRPRGGRYRWSCPTVPRPRLC